MVWLIPAGGMSRAARFLCRPFQFRRQSWRWNVSHSHPNQLCDRVLSRFVTTRRECRETAVCRSCLNTCRNGFLRTSACGPPCCPAACRAGGSISLEQEENAEIVRPAEENPAQIPQTQQEKIREDKRRQTLERGAWRPPLAALLPMPWRRQFGVSRGAHRMSGVKWAFSALSPVESSFLPRTSSYIFLLLPCKGNGKRADHTSGWGTPRPYGRRDERKLRKEIRLLDEEAFAQLVAPHEGLGRAEP